MSSLNRAQIIGYLGADPEGRAMPSGDSVANMRIATTEKWTDKKSGSKQERTEWHTIALFGKLAEIACQYLVKGSLVYIEGQLRTRKWQDKQGNDRYSTEIVARELKMLGGKRREDDGAPPTQRAPEPSSGPDEFSDDIPFVWAFLAPLGASLLCIGHIGQFTL